MLRIYPVPEEEEAARQGEALDTPLGLAEAYAYPPREAGPYLRANMVGSLDGAARAEGRSAPLSSDADMRVFGVLRALADVILVGAETARHEGYRPAKARAAFAARRAADGQSPAPAIAVISRRLDLDFDAPLFAAPSVPTLLLTGAGAPRAALDRARAAGAEVVIAGEGDGVEPARVVRELAARGHARLLHEGGPRVLAQFAAAGVLDELCLTVSPLLTGGDAPRIMNGPGVTPPARYVPRSVLEEDGFLFTRYVRA
ncbi:pyrimidine reductase family protein [Actinacidiphila sp. DG2A-62]|uniref:pyrimidine reductase family protein n=1 Tax=Actinacidiphila sp. DG2A-62 TaxID=3108821 RepID=UPI003FA39379